MPEPATDPKLHEALRRHDNKLTVRSVIVAVGAVAASVVAGLIFIDNRVRAETDAGVKVHEQRITTLEQNATTDREKTSHELKRVNKKVDRLEDKMDLLLDKANVPQSKRPVKDDEP
jgi:uncharacterized coiled-coil protein SlyX